MYQLGRMEEAYEHFLMAVGFEPENALAEFNLGCVLRAIGKTDEAIVHLSRAVELVPSLADGHLNLALAFEKNGKVHEVLRICLCTYATNQMAHGLSLRAPELRNTDRRVLRRPPER